MMMSLHPDIRGILLVSDRLIVTVFIVQVGFPQVNTRHSTQDELQARTFYFQFLRSTLKTQGIISAKCYTFQAYYSSPLSTEAKHFWIVYPSQIVWTKMPCLTLVAERLRRRRYLACVNRYWRGLCWCVNHLGLQRFCCRLSLWDQQYLSLDRFVLLFQCQYWCLWGVTVNASWEANDAPHSFEQEQAVHQVCRDLWEGEQPEFASIAA